MKRRDWIIGCSFILAVVMTGCGSKQEAEVKTEVETTAQTETMEATEIQTATEVITEAVTEVATETASEVVEMTESTEAVVWGYDKEEYVDTWEYEEKTEYLVINEDDTWQLYNANQTLTQEGTWELTAEGIALSDAEGKIFDQINFVAEGTLEAGDGALLDRAQMESLVDISADPTVIVGKWKYEDYDVYLEIHDDMTCEMMDEEGESFNGTEKITVDGTSVKLSLEDGTEDITLSMNKDGNLLDVTGDILTPADKFPWE